MPAQRRPKARPNSSRPQQGRQALRAIFSRNFVVVSLINLLLMVLGCFMDMAPLIIIMTPILLPVVESIGMSRIHFGIMLIFNLAIGLCTPPVGSALFVGCAVGKTGLESTSKKMLPLFACMIIVLMVVTYLPFYVHIPLFGY